MSGNVTIPLSCAADMYFTRKKFGLDHEVHGLKFIFYAHSADEITQGASTWPNLWCLLTYFVPPRVGALTSHMPQWVKQCRDGWPRHVMPIKIGRMTCNCVVMGGWLKGVFNGRKVQNFFRGTTKFVILMFRYPRGWGPHRNEANNGGR